MRHGASPPRLWSGPLNPRRSDNRAPYRPRRRPWRRHVGGVPARVGVDIDKATQTVSAEHAVQAHPAARSASERARATPAPSGCPSSMSCGCYWALGVAMVSAHPRSRPRTPAEAKCELGRMRAVTSQIMAHCLLLGPTTVWRARRCSTQGAPSAYLCVCMGYGFRRYSPRNAKCSSS